MTTGADGDRPTETTGVVYFATLVIALGGLLFGYNATVIAGAILFIEKQFTLSPLREESVIAASLVGALIVGLSYNYVAYLLPPVAVGVNIMIMVIILLIKPTGLFAAGK